MHIITVYPLAKGLRAQTLDYFFSRPIPPGTVVYGPAGNRTIPAVVKSCQPAQKKKSRLRSAEYALKQLGSVGGQVFFAQFQEAVRRFARFSGITTGAAIRALTPGRIIDAAETVPDINYDFFLPEVAAPQPDLLLTNPHKQPQYINSIIDDHRKRNQTVFVCTPTQHLLRRAHDFIAADTVCFSSELTKNELIDRWRSTVTETDPTVIIGTPPFLALPRPDLERIIVLKQSDDSYKMQSRPFVDKQLFARQFARTIKRQCTLVDSVPTVETQWQHRHGEITAAFQPERRRTDTLETDLVDMKEHANATDTGVQIFSSPAAQLLRNARKQGQKVVLFVARRGRRPFTVCNDCGQLLRCSQCEMPMVLVETDQTRQYVCRTCGNTETSQRRCDNCSSWRLQPLGIGIDFVEEILAEQLPETPVYTISGDRCDTDQAVEEQLERFRGHDGAVLLTTRLGITHLSQAVDASVVVTADSLLAVPDLSVSHQLFDLLMTIRDYTQEAFYIQTRSQQTDLLSDALEGNITSFYKSEIAKREQFGYPPFSYLIKLTVTGSSKQVQKQTTKLRSQLEDYDLQIYPARGVQSDKHVLLTLDTDQWVDDELLAFLRSLPESISVNAHPRSLL